MHLTAEIGNGSSRGGNGRGPKGKCGPEGIKNFAVPGSRRMWKNPLFSGLGDRPKPSSRLVSQKCERVVWNRPETRLRENDSKKNSFLELSEWLLQDWPKTRTAESEFPNCRNRIRNDIEGAFYEMVCNILVAGGTYGLDGGLRRATATWKPERRRGPTGRSRFGTRSSAGTKSSTGAESSTRTKHSTTAAIESARSL